MTDLALRWIDGAADVVVSGADLLTDETLYTAVVLSLFCEARASKADVLPEGETARRGWWGDQFAPDAGDNTGSKLWLLLREKRVPQTLSRAKVYAEESLQWMLDDGVASAVTVATSFQSIATLTHSSALPHEWVLVLEVSIDKPTGTQESFRFAYQWQQMLLLGVSQ